MNATKCFNSPNFPTTKIVCTVLNLEEVLRGNVCGSTKKQIELASKCVAQFAKHL
jgi:hypothetical protein